MQNLSKIVITAIISALIGGILAFFITDKSNVNQKDKTENIEYLTFYDSISGLTFDYNKDWVVEKRNSNSADDWYILAHAPFEKEYFKTVRITISPIQDLDAAVKEWWLEHYDGLNVPENKVYFQHPQTHRYHGVTYAANRAQFKEKVGEDTYLLDFRVMAVNKQGKTILLVERAERGGMDGLEADGLITIEKTINIIEP